MGQKAGRGGARYEGASAVSDAPRAIHTLMICYINY
jgi:hypothetical protein